LTKSGHFWSTYLPRLVYVVCERPPRGCSNWLFAFKAHILKFLCVNKRILNDVVQLFYLEKSAVQFQHWLGKMTIFLN